MTLRSFFGVVDLVVAIGGGVVDGVRWIQKKLAPEETPTGPLPRRNEDSIREQVRHATMRPPPASSSPMDGDDAERNRATVNEPRNR
jgi:hypothetical protein